VEVNRYILQKDNNRILVYYWFQGRGRVTAGEAQLKLHAITDAFISHRDEEALARIVVPVTRQAPEAEIGTTGLQPDSLATRFVAEVIPALQRALPAAP
jgi:EpsI family protein